MKNRLTLSAKSKEHNFSNDILLLYEKTYGIRINNESRDAIKDGIKKEKQVEPFEVKSITDALGYFEKISYDKECDLENIQKYIISLSNFDEKKLIIIETSKKLSYRYLEKIEIIFDINSKEFLFFNTALFIYTNNGSFKVLTNFDYLENAYKINATKTFEYLKEILSLYITEHAVSYMLTCNLFSALIKLDIPKDTIKSLFEILDISISSRFPDVEYNIFSENEYADLSSFSYEELLVTLLIARLKTFTGEKNRNIILGVKYITLINPKLLIKPYAYIFSHSNLLLPSQRAILLQILYESLPCGIISDDLKNILKSNYPLYFFTEDYYIRKICRIENKLLPCLPNRFIYPEHEWDGEFLSYLSKKYELINETYGEISGSYNEYQKYRHDYSEQYRYYSLELEEICAPIVNYQDIVYQIVNQRLYAQMDLSEKENIFNVNCINCSINQTIQNITSLTKRPDFLPFPNTLESKPQKLFTYFDNTWVLICASEKQYITVGNYKKIDIYSKILLVTNKKIEQPVIEKNNHNELDNYHYFLFSGFLVNKLGLKFSEDIFHGFYYKKEDEIVARTIYWREQYMGSIEAGYEIPSVEGTALLVRKDFLDVIDFFYNKQLILYQEIKE